MKEIAIVGMGNMGSAIQERLQDDFQVTGIGRGDDLASVRAADAVVLAVKPQSFSEVASELRMHITEEQLVISIMAGVTIGGLTDALGTSHMVRTMPNLALKTCQSTTAWYAEASDVEADTEAVLNTWGLSVRLEREEQFDAFTAICGSGPAYYFELVHLLEAEAVRLGFSAQDARVMSIQTLRGAASILEADSSPKELVRRVASKGGTTEAALAVFQALGFERMVTRAIRAACERSRSLGKGNESAIRDEGFEPQ